MSTLPPKTDGEGQPLPARPREFEAPFGVGSIKVGMRFRVPVCRMCIELYDHDGLFVQSSVRSVPRTEHMASLVQMCHDLQRSPIEGDGANALDEAALTVMMQIIGMCGALQPIRDAVHDRVVKFPTFMDVIASGLRLRLEVEMSDIQSLQAPWAVGVSLGPCQQSRFPVMFAGQKLFDCRLISGPIAPPYHLTAGVLMLEAVHPNNPDNRLTMRVLAAKRLGGK